MNEKKLMESLNFIDQAWYGMRNSSKARKGDVLR